MAPKRKAAASKPRAAKKRTTAAAAADAAAAEPAPARKGRGAKAASKPAAAAPSAAPKKAAAPKRGAKVKTQAAAAASAQAAPSGAAVTAPGGASSGTHPVDEFCAASGVEVVGDYDTVMNQTNVDANNNKFYRLQMLQQVAGSGMYLVWTRWGRVGVAGQSKMLGPFATEDGALREFKSKFRSKAGAAWENRASIEPKPGKYVPVEIDLDAKTPQKSSKSPAKKTIKYKPSALDNATQDLISLIFDDSMFTSAMKEFEIDVEKFPLGQLSKAQVAKGHAVLQELKDAMNRSAGADTLKQLTSKFFTTIPHAFGFRRPPVLNTMDAINAKVEMCNVLSDIEIAQGMLAEREESEQEEQEQDHPADEKYGLLNAELELLSSGDDELPVIQQYISATVGHSAAKLAHVWRVGRKGEAEQFAQHAKLGNRRLLWHGTNVAVVAAVLKTGLRIMPHSGGRVGKGIYLASEYSKSAAYVRCGKLKSKSIGVMFLAEAALGKAHSIMRDDPSLVTPPKGHDSVVARGRREPDPSRDATVELDGEPVAVPQGPPVPQPQYADSFFDQSEYLLYKESQARLRYLISFDFSSRGY